MNGVDELTNKIIRAAIRGVSYTNNLCDLRGLRGEYLTAIRAPEY